MAKQMTDEQKLFFGTKAQRAAVKRKHPSWAKDKSGFRQTVNGKHRNPFKTQAKKAAKKAVRSLAKKAVRSVAKKVVRAVAKRTGGGGSSSWEKLLNPSTAATDIYRKQVAQVLGDPLTDLLGKIDKTLTHALGGDKHPYTGGPVMTAGLPAISRREIEPHPDVSQATLDIVKESNAAWIDDHPGADIYGIYDPQYAIA